MAAVTRVPSGGNERRCAHHAALFWRAVVRVGAALAEVGRADDPPPVVIDTVPVIDPALGPRRCRDCPHGLVDVVKYPHGSLCVVCRYKSAEARNERQGQTKRALKMVS